MNEQLLRGLRPVPILVAGDVMVDEYILGDVDRISPESPVPVLVVRDRLRRLGGAGNVVKNLVSMGGKVALFGTVGKDEAGRWFRECCEELAVESFWLREHDTRPTTIKTRVVARNQQIVRVDQEQISSIPKDLETSFLGDVDSVVPQVKAVVVSDYGKGFLTQEILRALIRCAKVNRIPVLVDPKGMDYGKYRGATHITPNVREASVASGIEIRDKDSLVRAGRALLDQTEAEAIIITRGKDGITLVTRTETTNFPVKPVEIIDVTGAGDTVIAALALSVANGFSLENSISVANLAASLVVSRFGAASVTVDEMVDALNNRADDSKEIRLEDLVPVLRTYRLQGKQIVFTNGCFDLFHSGHLKTLREASQFGDVLVVGVNSDKSIRMIKGEGRPILQQSDRVEMISALSFVDHVVVFDEETPLRLIEAIRPDYLVKGDDWEGREVVGGDIVTARGGQVKFVKLVKGISTTDLIDKIRGG